MKAQEGKIDYTETVMSLTIENNKLTKENQDLHKNKRDL